MQSINVRGTFLAMRACIPHLKRSENGHILTLSPPINLDPAWLGAHAAYTLSKYGMTLLTLSAAEELREAGVAANTLWPRTIIATAAVQNLLGGDEAMSRARTPRDLRRLGLRDPHQAVARVHRPDADRRRGARRRRRHRSRALPRRAGDGELIGDLFVDPRHFADARPLQAGGRDVDQTRVMDWLGDVVATWFLVAVLAAAGRRASRGRCGCRRSAPPGARSASGYCCTSAGSTALQPGALGRRRPDASRRDADALWLMPRTARALVGMIALVRARHVHVNASLWLDAMIGGRWSRPAGAVFALHPILATSAAGEPGRARPTSPTRSATCC